MCSLRSYALVLALLPLASAQTTPASAPDPDGFYQVASTSLKRLESSPKLMFPPELSAHEVADRVVVAVTIAPDGTVKTAKVVNGRYRELKETVEKTVQKWTFQPYLVSGAPVPVRTVLQLVGGCHGGPDRKYQILQANVAVADAKHPIGGKCDDGIQ